MLYSGAGQQAHKVSIFFYEKGSRGRDVLTDFLGDADNAYVFIGDELKSAQFKDTVIRFACLTAITSLLRLPIKVTN